MPETFLKMDVALKMTTVPSRVDIVITMDPLGGWNTGRYWKSITGEKLEDINQGHQVNNVTKNYDVCTIDIFTSDKTCPLKSSILAVFNHPKRWMIFMILSWEWCTTGRFPTVRWWPVASRSLLFFVATESFHSLQCFFLFPEVQSYQSCGKQSDWNQNLHEQRAKPLVDD